MLVRSVLPVGLAEVYDAIAAVENLGSQWPVAPSTRIPLRHAKRAIFAALAPIYCTKRSKTLP